MGLAVSRCVQARVFAVLGMSNAHTFFCFRVTLKLSQC
jgi:hypothetical protein